MGIWLFTSTHNATVLSHRPKTECCPYNMMNTDPHAHTYTHWPPLLFPLFWPRLTRTPSVTLQREIDYRKEIFCLSGLLCFTGLQVFLCPPPPSPSLPSSPSASLTIISQHFHFCLSHFHIFLSISVSYFLLCRFKLVRTQHICWACWSSQEPTCSLFDRWILKDRSRKKVQVRVLWAFWYGLEFYYWTQVCGVSVRLLSYH